MMIMSVEDAERIVSRVESYCKDNNCTERIACDRIPNMTLGMYKTAKEVLQKHKEKKISEEGLYRTHLEQLSVPAARRNHEMMRKQKKKRRERDCR